MLDLGVFYFFAALALLSSILVVMSRNAVARFKDPSAQLPEMTRELHIGAVLAGSVRQAGSQVRVSVQLLAAPSDRARSEVCTGVCDACEAPDVQRR